MNNVVNQQSNPYQAPPDIDRAQSSASSESRTWQICFWCGAGLTAIGMLAFFSPNLPFLGFAFMALMCFATAAAGSQRYRKRAVIGLGLCLLFSGIGLYQLQMMQARIAVERARAQAIAQQQAAQRAIDQAAKQTSSRLTRSAE